MAARNGTSLVLFPAYAPTLTLVSCCFSVLGAAAIILTYICWKESRSTSRTILLCLALSDLISALGYIFGAGLFLETFHNAISVDAESAKNMRPFWHMCELQSFVTTTAMMSSFWWTTILSLHLFLSVARMRLELSRRLFPLYLFLSIAVPLAITVPSASTGWLGMGNGSASVSWCFITLKVNATSRVYDPVYDILEFVAGKMWELLAFVFIFSLYVALKCAMSKRVSWQLGTPTTRIRSTHQSHYTDPCTHKLPIQGLFVSPLPSPPTPPPSSIHLSPPLPLHQRRNLEQSPLLPETSRSSSLRAVENKLLLIPFLFILSRLFGMLRYALSLVFLFTDNYSPPVNSALYYPGLVGLHVSEHAGRQCYKG